LLAPRAAAYRELGAGVRPVLVNDQLQLTDDPTAGRYPYSTPYLPAQPYGIVNYPQAQGQVPMAVRPVPTALTAPAPQRTTTRTIERPGRNWKKTALVIGGSTAAGAGLGGIFGGKKGALIGAAIGGGASTLFEVTRK